jgi:protein TonB
MRAGLLVSGLLHAALIAVLLLPARNRPEAPVAGVVVELVQDETEVVGRAASAPPPAPEIEAQATAPSAAVAAAPDPPPRQPPQPDPPAPEAPARDPPAPEPPPPPPLPPPARTAAPRTATAPPAAEPPAIRLEPPGVAGSGFAFGEAVRPARPDGARNAPPAYPEAARRRGEQGVVTLEVDVAADGSVSGIRVAAGSGSAALDQAALDAVRRWRFTPAAQDGRPVPSSVRTSVRFRLED